MTSRPNPEAQAALDAVRRELFALCEATEDQCRAVAERYTEGKQGAFARGRMFEAKGIRRTMGEVIDARLKGLDDRDG